MGLDSWLVKVAKSKNMQIIAELKDGTQRQNIVYWRKNYTIHDKLSSFRTTDEDNCTDIPLTKENLKEIIDWIDDLEKKEWVDDFEDKGKEESELQELRDILIKLLEETNFEQEEIVYYAWY